MSDRIFKQWDSRWGYLKYPYGNSTLASSGCGCCSCTHLLIEIDKYKNWTFCIAYRIMRVLIVF